ncbi:MAG: hypothetical protein E7661_09075 [Ruminococcaceae bacterium]|nr:hypothetical protein [Oscillospiraceae bacterium]
MKNLFTHEILSDDDETYVPFENPYLVSRVSSETEQLMHCTPEDHDEPTLSDEEKNALKSKEKTFLLCILLSFGAALISFMLATRVESLKDSPIILVSLAGIVAAFIFLHKVKQIQWKRNGMDGSSLKDVDFEALAERINEASKTARAEMGIPDDDVSVEILPYGYKKKGDKQVSDKKANQFDNSPMSMHVKDGKLRLFDGIGLYEIPLSDIKGYRTYDKDYRIDFWLKEEETTHEKYQAFNLRKCGILEYKTHTYYGVEIISEATGETFEMLVPGYDLEELKKVIDVEALA